MRNWELRREVQGWDTNPELRFAMCLVIDLWDWNTNSKVFVTKNAFYQWVWGTAKRYHLSAVMIKEAITVLKEAGALQVEKLSTESRCMTLVEPTNRAGALEAFKQRWKDAEFGYQWD